MNTGKCQNGFHRKLLPTQQGNKCQLAENLHGPSCLFGEKSYHLALDDPFGYCVSHIFSSLWFCPVPWCGLALNFSMQPQSTFSRCSHTAFFHGTFLDGVSCQLQAACKKCLGGGRQGQVWNRFEREIRLKNPGNCCAEVWISSWIAFCILQSCLHSYDAQGKMRIFTF